MDEEAHRLRELLAGRLEREDKHELETRLAKRPSLRRRLADLALEADPTRAAPALHVDTGTYDGPAVSEVEDDVQVGPLLGRGGMAVVRLGRQLKLDRPVAVKSLRREFRGDVDVDRLLREARITGRLEHPNIVPIHDIVRGEDGLPQVVLKLIEGHTWSTLMRDAERVRELCGVEDLLAWNLDVLMAVARALAFAHSRNVIHRDVKPSNVMVGPFGEVYLVDWGIAVDLEDPDEIDLSQPSGTTGYMAPEQFGLPGARVGPWTDTYLLGATLYHILAGHPPHRGRSLESRRVETEAGHEPRPLPEDVPAELRGIVSRALAPDPADRTPTPERFRLELADFLKHRGALRLAASGDRERERAGEASARGDQRDWERASLAAEVAYRAALEEWGECQQAVEGVRRLATLRVEHALAADDLATALRIVEARDDLPSDLTERVAEAASRAEEERERLARLVTDADRGLGHRMRGLFGGLFGLIWVGFWTWMAFRPPEDTAPLLAFPAVILVVGLASIAWFAPQLFQNRINRTSVLVIIGGLLLTILWCLGAGWLGLTMRLVLVGCLLVFTFFASGMAILMDPWGSVSAVGYATAFLVAARHPAATPWAMLGGNAVLITNQLVLNWARGRRGFEAPPKVGASARSTSGGAAEPDAHQRGATRKS